MHPFTLVAEDGATYDVVGSLILHTSPGGMKSWSGSISNGPDLGHLVGENLVVRTEQGDGKAMLIEWNTVGHGQLRGTGPAPGHS